MAFIGFRVSDELAGRFEAVAATRGGKSRLLRSLIETLTQTAASAHDLGLTGRGGSNKVTIRFNDEDLAALDATSAELGMRRTEWVTACVRRRLFGRPQLSRPEGEALLEARRELRRISVNLRELVRSVREGDVPIDDLEPRLEKVAAFQADVRRQLDGVRGALAGNSSYWAGDGE